MSNHPVPRPPFSPAKRATYTAAVMRATCPDHGDQPVSAMRADLALHLGCGCTLTPKEA